MMEVSKTDQGFSIIEYPDYLNGNLCRLIQESSAVGDCLDGFDRPGSSFLWIGEKHHLNREEVQELVHYLRNWLKTGELKDKPKR